MPQFLYPQIGIVVGIPIMILITVAIGLLVRHTHRTREVWGGGSFGDDGHWQYWARGLGVIIGSMMVIATVLTIIFGAMPFQPSYWGVYAVQGKVAGISNQLASHDGDISGIYYTVALEGGPAQLYTSDDTRLSSVKKGDELGLKCRKVWHFNAVDTWECDVRNFGYVTKVGA